MNRHDIARQTQVEQELLGHIMHVLRTSSSWPVPGPDGSRKLSTLRFVAQSFQRHLEHLLTLEDAVRKMTSMNAAKFGLRDRGVLRAGAFADVTIFDPAKK